MLVPLAHYRLDGGNVPGHAPCVYITFDDGPIPEATPEVLDILRRLDIKATFFMVGDNVRKYPELYRRVLAEGHAVGNHTMHHLQATACGVRRYMRDVEDANCLIGSRLFRPPHGWLGVTKSALLRAKGYKIVMYDLITRDYSKRIDARRVLQNVKRYARPGSIIVFHDSLKSIDKLRLVLEPALLWLRSQGYVFGIIDDK